MKTKSIRARGVGLLVLAVLPLSTSAQILDENADHVVDEVLVQFRPGAASSSLADAVQRAQLTVNRHLPARGRWAGESGLVVMKTRLPVADAMAALRNHPAVEYAEPNILKHSQATSNDTYYRNGKLWGMYGSSTVPANPFGSHAGEAWAAGNLGSSDIYVAVLDQGIDINHPDLAANIAGGHQRFLFRWLQPDRTHRRYPRG